MKARWMVALVCLLLAIPALAAGCGDDGDSSNGGDAAGGGGSATATEESTTDGDASSEDEEPAEAPSSKAEFVTQANAACAEAWEEALGIATAYVERHAGDEVPEEVLNGRGLKLAVLKSIEREIEALQALGAPDGEEEQVAAVLSTLEAGYQEAEKRPANLTLVELENRLEAAPAVKSYGLARCEQLK